jgi:hypothetical protein
LKEHEDETSNDGWGDKLGSCPPLPSAAAALSAKDLVGTWTLVEVDAYGPNRKEAAMFDANGRFSMIFLRGDLPKYAANSRTQAAPAESKVTVDGSLAYFRTYYLSGTDLTFHIEGSTFANWTGGDQKRINVTVTADELKYVQPTPSGGGSELPVVWRRVK